MNWVLHAGDNRNALRVMADNSIDSCVTDPPYALVSIVKRFGSANAAPARGNEAYMRASAGFMGKQWDTGESAMNVDFWAEVLRVLKPGAFLCAFGATRGYHRMACAIEDAGFEIRDSLCWLYGTGFPKSHDVSKGIDKAAGAEREVIGKRQFANGSFARDGAVMGQHGVYGTAAGNPLMTAPATPEAAEWEGWGTALKPAFEPIVLARKPLSEGTVAANVLRWRTGALNIGGCRIPGAKPDTTRGAGGQNGRYSPIAAQGRIEDDGAGRWPANVVHSGEPEVVGCFPNSKSTPFRANDLDEALHGGGTKHRTAGGFSDEGSAARFFYSAKASKADRAGSKHPTVKPIALMAWLVRLVTPPGGTVLDPFAGSGTTGAAALQEGFRVILCEREAEYVADIRRRLGVSKMPWETAPAHKMPWET